MPLPWVRLDTNLPSHDKMLTLIGMKDGYRAGFVYVCGLAYCGQNETDGFIPTAALPFVHGRKADAERLVEVGLWAPAPNGWQLRNWDGRQQSVGTSKALRAGQRLGALKANCVRWHGPECGCWKNEATA